MKKEFVPGWALMVGLAVLGGVAKQYVIVGEKAILDPAIVAILVGVILRNLNLLPRVFDAGIKAFEKPLILGIVLYGAGFQFKDILRQGPAMLGTIVITMAVGLLAIVFLSRLMKLPRNLGVLLAVGTTICGGSAIAVTAPLLHAKEEETSYAITTIALWGMVAILVYPLIAHALGVSGCAFGVFAGTAIHSTPQVAGAGQIYADMVGSVIPFELATGIKLVRNCFMVPMAFVIALLYGRGRTARDAADQDVHVNVKKGFPWYLFGFFLMGALSSKGYFSEAGVHAFKTAAKFLILVGLAGVGLNTRFSAFKGIGGKPFLVGLIGSAIVAAVSIACILGFKLYVMPGA